MAKEFERAMASSNQHESLDEHDSIKTTVGDLIEAVTEIALETGKTEQEAYKLASLTLENILNRKKKEEAPLIN